MKKIILVAMIMAMVAVAGCSSKTVVEEVYEPEPVEVERG